MKAVIFDMDGVIVDSEQLQMQAEKMVCEKYGAVVDDNEWINFKGMRSVDIFAIIIKKYNVDATPEKMLKEKCKVYVKIAEKELRMFPGFRELIAVLKGKFVLALTTSSVKEMQEYVFNKYKLNGIFDVIVTGDMVSKGKPDPEPYLLTIKKLGVDASDCFVIEDSDNGVLSAKRAGAKAIAVTHTFLREKLVEADYVFDNLEEIKDFFEGEH